MAAFGSLCSLLSTLGTSLGAASHDLLLFYQHHSNWLGAAYSICVTRFSVENSFLGNSLLYKVCLTLCHFYFRF